ncbi:ATP-dependent helicase/nuclease subunit B [Rhizomicrobium palustre]|uniref:ATP-dependent helicase/nuclease subunit B n=1 Tax=Rhizomicrobium palustre TaxID=189966 RepID=A0A846N675_9PROT|nr:double-strand break repair protein AddB [Rhizomicrobium palustre]NIK90490.1 ATP-dependent helicase/nuclease subunit B [Rhizomicrobium palustre]
MPQPPEHPRANVFTIPASAAFSEALAKGLAERLKPAADNPLALADVTIYLPTQRAARSFREIFARLCGGATLLPEFRPLGEVDEDELLFATDSEVLDLPPRIAPLRQRLLLATLIRRWSHARDGGTMTFGQAVALSKSLAGVMDEVETQGADLAKLKDLAPANLAEHWAEVREFLSLIDTAWPGLLEAEGAINPAAHRDMSIRALAARLENHPPERFILAAGSTGSIPATAELLRVIAHLPKGAVVLPGLDRELDAESWERLEPGHPQYGMKQLLTHMGVRRDQVGDWIGDWITVRANAERERLLREVLRPAPTTDAWRALAESLNPPKCEGLSLFEAADPGEEAEVIALMLREALESKDKTAALISRDRGLARRVTAALKRWDIEIDDSAGRPLSRMAAGSFLLLLAEAADEEFSPVPLLALLKHPLCTMGDEAGALREMARRLDKALRGPRPDAGLSGIAKALTEKSESLQIWFAKLREVLAPLETVLAKPEAELSDILNAHIEAADTLAPEIWAGTDGVAASRFLTDLASAAANLPVVETGSYAPMLRSLMDEVPVRPSYGKHPRLFILGPLEARLQSFDLVILGGLNEGVWPQGPADDPWFSRPMRATLGLEQPERAIGLSAHDFAGLSAAPRVVLTRSVKSEGTPMVASRWLQRLTQLTRGLGIEGDLALDPKYRSFATALNDPGLPAPERPPYPKPPVKARPREMSVTDVEKWVRDPYAIYAKRVLGLKKLDALDAELGPRERGTALHEILERFIGEHPTLPVNAEDVLAKITQEVLTSLKLPQATLALWRPRFLRAAEWFLGEERKRRAEIAESYVEKYGEITFDAPGGDFTLKGIADRIDRLNDGSAVILDYKTGEPPSGKQVKTHLSPQMPLEAAMLREGGFKDVPAMTASDLIYVQISGAAKAGEFKSVGGDAEQLAAEALEKLKGRVRLFDDENIGYAARVAPVRKDADGDYDHLARVKEWSSSGWGEE